MSLSWCTGSPVGCRSSAPVVLPAVFRWNARTSCHTLPGCGSFHVIARSVLASTTVLGGAAGARPSVKAFTQATPLLVAPSRHWFAVVSLRSGVGGCSSFVANGCGDLRSNRYAVVLVTSG